MCSKFAHQAPAGIVLVAHDVALPLAVLVSEQTAAAAAQLALVQTSAVNAKIYMYIHTYTLEPKI